VVNLQDLMTLGTPAFVLGVFGGGHCIGMCGGVVAAATLGRTGPLAPVVAGYNLGRVTSYVAAGALAGGFGAVFAAGGEVISGRIALLVVAQLLVIAAGLALAGYGGGLAVLERATGSIWRQLSPLAARLMTPRGLVSAFGMGAVWGWVPCGLVYGALFIALATGDPARGALTMLAFGMGTLPAMLALGAGAVRLRPWLAARGARRAAGLLVAFSGLVGLSRIPGLVEQLTGGLICLA